MTTRRKLLAGALASIATPAVLRAEPRYPANPVRVIVPFGPGGLADVTIRVVGQRLGELLGQSIVVVNQPGAGGVAAASAVINAPADGYTLAMFTNGTAISVAIVEKLAFDPLKDFRPISSLGFFDFLFVTAAAKPYRTLADVVAAAKARAGAIKIGTINVGSSQHLSGALFNSTAGIETTLVPHRTSPDVLAALLRGDVDLAIDGYVVMKSMLASGAVVALATSGAVRASYLPNVPTVKEALGAEFEVTSWNALFARAETNSNIIALLNTKIREAIADVQVKARLIDIGIEARGGTPEEIGARLVADIGKWSAVIARAGIPKQ